MLDPRLLRTAGPGRAAYLLASLRTLDTRLGGRLVVRTGRPEEVVPAVVREAAATSVHVSTDAYPAPIVDHATERREALDRLERMKE